MIAVQNIEIGKHPSFKRNLSRINSGIFPRSNAVFMGGIANCRLNEDGPYLAGVVREKSKAASSESRVHADYVVGGGVGCGGCGGEVVNSRAYLAGLPGLPGKALSSDTR